ATPRGEAWAGWTAGSANGAGGGPAPAAAGPGATGGVPAGSPGPAGAAPGGVSVGTPATAGPAEVRTTTTAAPLDGGRGGALPGTLVVSVLNGATQPPAVVAPAQAPQAPSSQVADPGLVTATPPQGPGQTAPGVPATAGVASTAGQAAPGEMVFPHPSPPQKPSPLHP